MTTVQALAAPQPIIPLEIEPLPNLRQVSYSLFRIKSGLQAPPIDELANNFKNWALDHELSISEDPFFGNRRHEIVAESKHARFLLYILGEDRIELNAFGARSVVCSLTSSLAPIFQLADLVQDERPAFSTAIKVCGRPGVMKLLSLLTSPTRRKPVIVVTEDFSGGPLVDIRGLASATFGMAHVFLLPAQEALYLTESVTKVWSVFRGAVRIYWPGLDFQDANPLHHPLTMGGKIRAWRGGATGYRDQLIAMMQAVSLKFAPPERHQRVLGRVATIQPAHIERRQFTAPAAVRKQPIIVDRPTVEGTSNPKTLLEIVDWASRKYERKLVLHPRVARAVKSSPFQNLDLVKSAIGLLAGSYRDMRIKGGPEATDAFTRDLEALGLHCRPSHKAATLAGNPNFQIDVGGETRLLDWQLRLSGNTRDPKRCFRVYFTWDDASKRAVIGHLPGHLPTSLS